jgi:hypothetical protein
MAWSARLTDFVAFHKGIILRTKPLFLDFIILGSKEAYLKITWRLYQTSSCLPSEYFKSKYVEVMGSLPCAGQSSSTRVTRLKLTVLPKASTIAANAQAAVIFEDLIIGDFATLSGDSESVVLWVHEKWGVMTGSYPADQLGLYLITRYKFWPYILTLFYMWSWTSIRH